MKKQTILQLISFWGNAVTKYDDDKTSTKALNKKKNKAKTFSTASAFSLAAMHLLMVKEWRYCMSQQKTTMFSLLPATKASKYQCFYMKSLITMENKTIMIYVVCYLKNKTKHPDQSH